MSEYILLRTSGPAVTPTADDSTHAINIVDYAHHEIHGGSAYFVIYSALADDTGAIEIRVQTPDSAKWAHAEVEFSSALAATLEFHEATTVTHEAGNAIVPMNRNRNSTKTSGLTVCNTPGGADTSGADWLEYIGSASVSGRGDVGGGSSSRHELILKQNEDYLIRLTSRADANALTIGLDWYEHTDK